MVANSILEYFANEKNIKLIERILEKGVKIQEEEIIEVKDNYFKGKKIVLTGSLETFSRNELSEILTKLGADVVSSVSKATDLVIVGKEAGSKLDKAKILNIELMDEEKLLKTLK